MYLFLAVLGLRCCAAFLCSTEWGLLVVTELGLLIVWFLLLQSMGSRVHGLQQL